MKSDFRISDNFLRIDGMRIRISLQHPNFIIYKRVIALFYDIQCQIRGVERRSFSMQTLD